MTHLYKWINQFADVFISAIDGEAVAYEVRDKVTGKLTEEKRVVRYVIDEINKQVYIDNRTMPLPEFLRAAQLLT